MAQIALPPGATLVDDQQGMKLPPGAVLDSPVTDYSSESSASPYGDVPQEKKTPGFFKRAAQGIGIPTSKTELEAMKPTTAEIVGGPAVTAGKVVWRYTKNVYGEGKKALTEASEAGTNVAEGGPVGANVGKATAGLSEFLFKGLLGPVGGGSIQAWGEDINSGNTSGAAGDAVAVLTNALLLKGATKPSTTARTGKIAFAADLPESMDAFKQVPKVLPDLDKAAAGKAPKTVGELLQTVKQAKESINGEVGQAIMPLRGKQTVPIPIGDAIKSHITPDMAQTREGRAMANALNKAAVDYQKPWSYEQLHAARINANARLRSFFKKGSTAQYGDMKTDVGVIVDREVARGVQDIVYPEMDKVAGKPPGYFSGLLNRQSTLITLGEALDENAKALSTRTAKIQGSPRFSTENVSAYGHPASTPGISVHKLQNVIIRPNPLKTANAAVARSFAGRPTATAAIYSLPVRELLIPNEDEKQPVKNRADALQVLGK